MCVVKVLVMSRSLSQSVCQFVSLSVTRDGRFTNGPKSEMTSSITTKQGVEMGSFAFSYVILFKSLSMKCEAQKVMEMVRFSQKNVETILLTYMFEQRYQQVGNRVMSK